MDKKEQNTAQLQIRIRPSLYDKLKKTCQKRYISVSGAIKGMILDFIEQNEEK